jgi:hypothetical protein
MPRRTALVIDRLGKDLDRLFKMCNRHFTLKTVLILADQLVRLAPPHPRPTLTSCGVAGPA